MYPYIKNSDVIVSDYSIPAYVLEGTNDKLYLFVDSDIWAKSVKKDFECEDSSEAWHDLITRYSFEKIVGRFNAQWEEDGGTTFGTKSEALVDNDLVGKWREEKHLRSLAVTYGMNVTQWMRFRLQVRAFLAIQIPINYDEIAKEVVSELFD
jgi:hypothetical protein